jgi:hypothetical protein
MFQSEIKAIIDELTKFSPDCVEIGASILDNRIELFEISNNIVLPLEVKQFYKQINGFSLMSSQVLPFDETKYGIEDAYNIEHFEVHMPMPLYYIPFYPDGGGNHYCFDTSLISSNQNICPIIFWQSLYPYSDIDTPEIVSNSFLSFIKETIIGWKLENYDYEGNEIYNMSDKSVGVNHINWVVIFNILRIRNDMPLFS